MVPNLRAPKAVGVTLRHIAVPPTTEGVIAALAHIPLEGRTIGVQLYGSANPALGEFLPAHGATMLSVSPYSYAPASDALRVAELIMGLATDSTMLSVSQSSPQVTRLVEVAKEQGALAQAFLGHGQGLCGGR